MDLKENIQKIALQKGDFILSSGEESSYYFDIKKILLKYDFLNEVKNVISKEIGKIEKEEEEIDAVAGIGLGGTILVTSIAGYYHHNVEGCIVREQRKNYGTQKKIENPQPSHSRVIILEDVITSGKSVSYACDALLDAGNVILGVIAILDRQEDGVEYLEYEYNCIVKCLYKRDDFDYSS